MSGLRAIQRAACLIFFLLFAPQQLAAQAPSDIPRRASIIAIADEYVLKTTPGIFYMYRDRHVWDGSDRWVVEYYNELRGKRDDAGREVIQIGGGVSITIDKKTNLVNGYWLGQ